MNKQVCGFIIVRRIEAASAFTSEYPRFLKTIPYEGLTRDSFGILSKQHHKKLLSDNILKYYSEASRNDDGYIGEYATDEVSALAMLEYSNKLEGEVNELIAFEMQGFEKHDTHLNLQFLGVDIVFYCGSMLYEGIFAHPEMFENYHSKINKHGLFEDNEEIINQYIDDYCLISSTTHRIEPANKDKDIIRTMRLFKHETV